MKALNLATRGDYLTVTACKFCGDNIAWARTKAGKPYPCNVIRKQSEEYGLDPNGVLRATPWSVHKCKGAPVMCRCGARASVISAGPWCGSCALAHVGTFPADDFARIEAGGYPLPRLVGAIPVRGADVQVGTPEANRPVPRRLFGVTA